MAMHVQSTQNTKHYLKKEVRDKFDILHKEKHQSFLQTDKLISLILVVIDKHAQSTQNKNFAKSSQYLQKEGKDEVDFLDADKHQTLLQRDDFNFSRRGQ